MVRAENYDVLKTIQATAYLAPNRRAACASALGGSRRTSACGRVSSFAAIRLAPVASPVLLLIYCVDERAVVWQRAQIDNGLSYVAPSQIVVDCPTGTGRMPAQGNASLNWMIEHEATWRYPSIDAAMETMARMSDSVSAPADGYTESMTTTIKVSSEVRDRLKGQAALAHRTLGQHLEHLASLGEREARLASLRAAVKATSPEDLESYRVETDVWNRIENG